MPRATRRFSSLLLLLLVALLVRAPTSAADPYHGQVENSVLGSEQAISDQQWLAQSFVPASSFFLSRVSLYVRDRGPSEALFVGVRTDVGGFPGVGILIGTALDAPGAAGWVDFDLSPSPELEANRPYWIVASTSAVGSQGYEWWGSGSNTVYPQGTGAMSADGVSWTYATEDYAFRVFGFQQPNLTFSVVASRPSLNVGQSLAFEVNFTNTGLGSANGVWANVTLAPELAYAGDDASLIGGVREVPLSFRFTNVTSGSWSFRLTVSASGSVPNGTVARTTFTFEGTDHNGKPATRVVQAVAVTIWNSGSPMDWVWWVPGLVAIPIGAGLFLLMRRRSNRASVEEVFVVHQNGILLAHQSKTLTPDKDEDLLASMLKTVQDFIQDAFSGHGPLPMRGLQFGEFNILIEPGRNHHVAVVYKGRDDGTLAGRLKDLSSAIEERFGNTLESWSGDMREVRGLRDLLPVLWGQRLEKRNQAGVQREDPEGLRRGVARPAPGRGIPDGSRPLGKSPFADEKG